jgi:hypothetical protein
MPTISETEVVQACRTLFGPDVNISKDFLLRYIQPGGVKSAYRKKAKENHPDLFNSDAAHIQQKQTVVFREILNAYDTLNEFFKQREDGSMRFTAAQMKPTGPTAQPREHAERRQSDRRADRAENDTYYTGMIPLRQLQIGQYLYYRGKISFGSLINALVWQRKQRPAIGDIALKWGWLDQEGINKIFSACKQPRLFGEKAVELGLLTVFQVNTILLYQRSQQHRLGNYFTEQRILSAEQLEQYVLELKEHNATVLAATRREAARNPSRN